MPTPTYNDPAAENLRQAVYKITAAFEAGLGLEPEVSFGTRLIGKRYAIPAIATSITESREGVIAGYQQYQMNINFQYVVVVPCKAPPDHDISTVMFLNGESAYQMQQFRGFVDDLNLVLPDGNMMAEVRVQSLDSTFFQQQKEPYAYEITILGTLGFLYYVRKGMQGQPIPYPIEPSAGSLVDY